MASSRSSPPAEGGERLALATTAPAERTAGAPSISADPVGAAVRRALAAFAGEHGVANMRVAVALSGGRDSMALLEALALLRDESGFSLGAQHVHHGLSPNADRWAGFCADECARRNVALTVERVRVVRAAGKSLEAAA